MINYHVTDICLHSTLDGLDIESPLGILYLPFSIYMSKRAKRLNLIHKKL